MSQDLEPAIAEGATWVRVGTCPLWAPATTAPPLQPRKSHERHPNSLIGAGNMAGAIIGGLLAQGVPARQLSASNRNPAKREALAREHGIRVEASNSACSPTPTWWCWGEAPGHGRGLPGTGPPSRPDQLIVSVAAGNHLRQPDPAGWARRAGAAAAERALAADAPGRQRPVRQ